MLPSGPVPPWPSRHSTTGALDTPAAGHVTPGPVTARGCTSGPVAGALVGDPGVTATLVRAADGTSIITTLASGATASTQRRLRAVIEQ